MAGKPFCLPGLSVCICETAFHSAAPNLLGAFLSTLGGISGPPRVIWVLPGLHPHLALAALEMLAFALWLRQDSFHSRPMHGLRRHLGHLSCIPYPCMSHRLGSETRFLLFTRLRFYLSQVVIIYLIACLLHSFLQPKMCGAFAPCQAGTILRALENLLVIAGKLLVFMELSLWRET